MSQVLRSVYSGWVVLVATAAAAGCLASGCLAAGGDGGADDSQVGINSNDNGMAGGGDNSGGNGDAGGGGQQDGGSGTGGDPGGSGSGGGEVLPIAQWASRVIDYSSQFGNDGWSAQQALGEPDVFIYGDVLRAWAPKSENGTQEFISVGFDIAVLATGVAIRETFGNGMVTEVELLDEQNVAHSIWDGDDLSQPGEPVDFAIEWTMTQYPVVGVRIHIDTDANKDTWEEIDAIELRGLPVN